MDELPHLLSLPDGLFDLGDLVGGDEKRVAAAVCPPLEIVIGDGRAVLSDVLVGGDPALDGGWQGGDFGEEFGAGPRSAR